MNDDIVVRSADWLHALLTFSIQDDVGVVGARLLYPNETVQHAGIPGGLFGLCAHAWLGQHAGSDLSKLGARATRVVDGDRCGARDAQTRFGVRQRSR